MKQCRHVWKPTARTDHVDCSRTTVFKCAKCPEVSTVHQTLEERLAVGEPDLAELLAPPPKAPD